jgi:hypothetical protein
LRSVESVDVISPWMRDAYKQKYKIDSFPVYRFVPGLPAISFQPAPGTLTVGHIGSVYHPEPFRRFLLACQQLTSKMKIAFNLVRIGSSPEIDRVASANPQVFENCGEQDEEKAVVRLASCDFLYAMYPAGRRFQCFRQTSLPMKLSTYVQAQRPIFAHTPGDSGLAELIEKYGVGRVCSSYNEDAIQQAIHSMLQAKITRHHFEALRSDLMGPNHLLLLKNALTRQVLSWKRGIPIRCASMLLRSAEFEHTIYIEFAALNNLNNAQDQVPQNADASENAHA